MNWRLEIIRFVRWVLRMGAPFECRALAGPSEVRVFVQHREVETVKAEYHTYDYDPKYEYQQERVKKAVCRTLGDYLIIRNLVQFEINEDPEGGYITLASLDIVKPIDDER